MQFNESRAYTLKNTSQVLYTEASCYFHRARTILEVIPSPDSEVISTSATNAFKEIFSFYSFLIPDCGHYSNCQSKLCCYEFIGQRT